MNQRRRWEQTERTTQSGLRAAEMIRARLSADETLRDLCEDHRLASVTLKRLRRERPSARGRIQEYSALVGDLEDEIIGYLLDPGRAKDD